MNGGKEDIVFLQGVCHTPGSKAFAEIGTLFPFPVERKFRLEVSIRKKGRVMVISNTFPIFPPPSLTTAPNHQGICTYRRSVRIPCTNSFTIKGVILQRTLGEQASSRGREKTTVALEVRTCVFRDQLTDRQGVDIGQLVEGPVLLARGRPREV